MRAASAGKGTESGGTAARCPAVGGGRGHGRRERPRGGAPPGSRRVREEREARPAERHGEGAAGTKCAGDWEEPPSEGTRAPGCAAGPATGPAETCAVRRLGLPENCWLRALSSPAAEGGVLRGPRAESYCRPEKNQFCFAFGFSFLLSFFGFVSLFLSVLF